ncbi:MAG: response regulator, partial [Candidatus Binatia bacterium]
MIRSKLLVIEDHNAISAQLEWALKDEFDLFTAGDRTSALMLTRECRPSVILLDLDLPLDTVNSEESFRFLREICECGFHNKVIVCTSDSEREHAVRAIGLGAYDFLTKPLDFDLLKLLIRRASWVAELEQEWRTRLAKTDDGILETDDGIKEMIGT